MVQGQHFDPVVVRIVDEVESHFVVFEADASQLLVVGAYGFVVARDADAEVAFVLAQFVGLLITAPFFWKYIADTDFLRLPLSGQAELAYVLVLGTVLPMYLLYRGTEKLTFIHTALYRYIQPVVATVLALVRHQEQIDRTNIIAGVLIFASIILVIREANLRGFFSSVQAPSPTPDGRSRKRP